MAGKADFKSGMVLKRQGVHICWNSASLASIEHDRFTGYVLKIDGFNPESKETEQIYITLNVEDVISVISTWTKLIEKEGSDYAKWNLKQRLMRGE